MSSTVTESIHSTRIKKSVWRSGGGQRTGVKEDHPRMFPIFHFYPPQDYLSSREFGKQKVDCLRDMIKELLLLFRLGWIVKGPDDDVLDGAGLGSA